MHAGGNFELKIPCMHRKSNLQTSLLLFWAKIFLAHAQSFTLKMKNGRFRGCVKLTSDSYFFFFFFQDSVLASNPGPSHEMAWYTLFTHALDFHTFP